MQSPQCVPDARQIGVRMMAALEIAQTKAAQFNRLV
jgi:hypothetical protein